MKEKVAVCWFRRDLRINDNAAFYYALKSGLPVIPVFIFDSEILDKLSDKKDKRVNFIHDNLTFMNDAFLKNGSSFFVIHDKPLQAFKQIEKKFTVEEVFTNQDYEPAAIRRDKEISDYFFSKNISFYSYKDQVIFEKSEIVKSDGSPYHVFTPYSKLWLKNFEVLTLPGYPSEKLLEKLLKTDPIRIPPLKDIGFEKIKVEILPLQIDKETLDNYDQNRNIPGISGTSHVSVQLRFGTISIRELATIAKKFSQVYLKELIWREFFMMLLFHYPKVVNQNFNHKYNFIKWRNDEADFKKWCAGETGFPLVDAGMRQLNESGWMHNRVRMIVAGFLCKDLLIDWRWGEAYFADKLLDYELSSNNGNWQWAAGTGADAAPYFRIFNPTTQIKNFDPKLNYIKAWIRPFKPGYMTEMVDHNMARKRALKVYKEALNEQTVT
ncbi:MAG: deoxyribodipyrimidine photo-lyase [Ginsengibacter sp.]|jgi:deoxyribodipyrimidine photo-lyase